MLRDKYFLYIFFGIVFCFLIWGVMTQNDRIIFISLLTCVIYLVIYFLEILLKIRVSFLFKCLVYVFVFCSQIFGEILNFYELIPIWDNLLHYSFGFLCTFVGFSIIRFCINSYCNVKKVAFIFTLFAICFSMTIGALWEFFEFSMDKYFGCDMQKDSYVNRINTVSLGNVDKGKVFSIEDVLYTNVYTSDSVIKINNGYLDIGLYDTMSDIFVNMLGAFTAGSLISVYIIFPCKVGFVKKFVIEKK